MANENTWEELIRAKAREGQANPAHPYNAHFYEARRGAEVRIFDLYRSASGIITIGECLPLGRPPLQTPLVPARESEAYVRVNYGGRRSESPDEMMATFAAEHGLSEVQKFAEIQTSGEMPRLILEVLRRLKVLQ